ncbi:MAG: APC family permease, partial [Candidatus Aminicenantaceae bacterium]
VNYIYLYALPIGEIVGVVKIAEKASTALFGGAAASIISAAVVISTFGALNGSILAGPRVYYAMAKDGLFFKKLAYVHPKFHTPVYAILVQSAWAVVLLLFWGTFEDLITYVVFTDWVFFGLTAVGIFILRRKRKDLPRPYRTIGYPVVPLIFITITFLFVVNALIAKPLHAWAGLILMAASLPLYFTFKRRASLGDVPQGDTL